jgi:hypothetical protein
MNTLQKKLPSWFWIIGIVSWLWNIMGIFSFVGHTFISEEALALLSEKEQSLYNSFPLWVTVVFAIAVLTGFVGSIMLLARQQMSHPIFKISLIAILIQMSYNIFFTSSIEVYGLVETLIMPIIVIVYGVFLVWFSKFAITKNWLH